MHPFEMKIINFMNTVANQSVPIDDLLLKPAQRDVEHFIRKLYEDEPNRPFTLRLSSIGRPLCQLQMERNKAPSVPNDWNFPLRMMYGGVIEGLAVSIMRHAGINIEEEQTHVKLAVTFINNAHPFGAEKETYHIPGTLDLVIDGRVWDVKSASSYSYAEKFKTYETLRDDDTFGYLPQLYGYAVARGIPPGGWIVVDKSSGEMKVICVPDDYEAEQARTIAIIENNVIALIETNKPFKRQFTDVDEKFSKRFTGNKILQSPCTFCKYKYECWPGLQHLQVEESKAFDAPYRFYTKHENKQLQGKGSHSSEENSSAYLRAFSQLN